MDNLTHTMTGVLLARTGLHRLAPRASATLVLAANAPDVDILAAGRGALNYLQYHRGITHSLIGLPLMALVVTAVMRTFWRKGPFAWKRTYLTALLGVSTHPLLDLMNTYGVRLGEPFSSRWYSWDILNIVDLWLWGGMIFCLAAILLARLIGGEIGAAPGSGRGWSLAGLAFVAVWCGGRAVLHHRAVRMLEAHAYGADGSRRAPVQVAAFPGPANPFVWKGVVETEDFFQVMTVDVRESLDPTRGEVYYKPEPSPELSAALATRTAQVFGWFARYRYARVEGRTVTFTDFRFAGGRARAFVCRVELDEAGKVVREGFGF